MRRVGGTSAGIGMVLIVLIARVASVTASETMRVGAVKVNIWSSPHATLPSDSLIASKARRARTPCPAVRRRVSPHSLSRGLGEVRVILSRDACMS
jgi:hypothetical protein